MFFFNLGRLVSKCRAGMSEKGSLRTYFADDHLIRIYCWWWLQQHPPRWSLEPPVIVIVIVIVIVVTAVSPQVVPGTPCLARFSEDDTIYRSHKFEITQGLLVTQKNTGQLFWNGTVPWRKSITWIMETVKVFPWEASFQCRLVSLPLRCCPLDAGRLW